MSTLNLLSIICVPLLILILIITAFDTTQIDSGNECGLSLDKFSNFQEHDEIECYRVEFRQKPLHLQAGVSGTLQTQSKVYDSLSRR